MKVNINPRAADELIEVMRMLDIQSPSHAVNTLITKFYKNLIVENPTHVEVNTNNDSEHRKY